MNIVITMAGLGTRFKNAGYSVPKYQIVALDKTLFDWSLDSLIDMQAKGNKYIFIVRKEDDAKSFIAQVCKQRQIEDYEVVELLEMTDGQATTALLAKECWRKEEALLIYNIDTYVEPYQVKCEDLNGDGHIPCFYAEGTHWSFVKLDEDGYATQVKEKVRISDNCSIGAYYFKTAQLYEDLYHDFYVIANRGELKERYIAPLYTKLIEDGGKVTISQLKTDSVHVLGTPDELDTFIASYNRG